MEFFFWKVFFLEIFFENFFWKFFFLVFLLMEKLWWNFRKLFNWYNIQYEKQLYDDNKSSLYFQKVSTYYLNLKKKIALGRDRTRVLLHRSPMPYPLRHEEEMKILMKKKEFCQSWNGMLIGHFHPCLMPIRVKVLSLSKKLWRIHNMPNQHVFTGWKGYVYEIFEIFPKATATQ